jgi:D-alanine--poly(phosphoribitol) ligase subunit 1
MTGLSALRIRERLSDGSSRPAVVVGRRILDYAGFGRDALDLSAVLQDIAADDDLVGIFAHRDETAYLAVAAILAAGKGYVPLSPKLPDDRLATVARLSGVRTILVGRGCGDRASALFPGSDRRRILIEASESRAGARQGSHSPVLDGSKPAYLLFTSGTTGVPKGVAVPHACLDAYVQSVTALYGYGPGDVHSQTFELTFDLSVHDMVCAWSTGGCLARLSGAELMNPAALVRRYGITCWFSVPSLGSMMQETGGLGPGTLSGLRVSLFCGEGLPIRLAQAWAEAAPGSRIENLYGPTEATIAFTRHAFGPVQGHPVAQSGLVPIGRPFDGQVVAIRDGNGTLLTGPGRGMLFLGGSQVAGAYWRDPETSAAKFHVADGMTWYETGDLVERDETGCLHFLGRMDSQVKVHGHRIELLEVENAVQEAAGTSLATVVAWPSDETRIHGLAAVVQGEEDPTRAAEIQARLHRTLPAYMVPEVVRFRAELPRNLSGKIDRKAILRWLDDGG